MEESTTFRQAADSFIHDLDALREVLDVVMIMAVVSSNRANEKLLKKLEEHGTLQNDDGESKTFKVPAEHLRQVDRFAKKQLRAKTAVSLLPRTFLVSFVSVYDAYLGNLIRVLMRLQPGLLDGSEKQFTFKQIATYASIDEARAALIEDEVESVLRESHYEQFKWIERKCGVKLREGLASWPAFIELTERRNLFVHTRGVVSNQYLQVCRQHGVDTANIKVSETLEADRKYLVASYQYLFEVGIKLSQVLWRKMNPSDLENADKTLNNVSYDLLVDEKYDLAISLLSFAVDVLKRYSSDEFKRMFLVNLAQAHKFHGDDKTCINVIDREDWSACGDNFRICIAVLRDNFGEASNLMKRIGSTGVIKESDYIDWPIFKLFRESPEFKAGFKSVFGHDPSSVQRHDVVRKIEL